MLNSWERARVEVPAERWADLSGHGYGVSLLNRSKYGYDIKGQHNAIVAPPFSVMAGSDR